MKLVLTVEIPPFVSYLCSLASSHCSEGNNKDKDLWVQVFLGLLFGPKTMK